MPDESADFQGSTPSYPPTDLKVAVDRIGGADYQRIKLDGGGDGVLIPVVAGRNADAASLPVALSTEDVAILSTLAGIVSNAKAAVKSAIGDIADLATLLTNVGALTETAPATDTASSGLNGRLQRIAQRITSLIALLPAALGSGGGLKVDGSGTALPVSGSVTATVSGSVTANAGTNLNTSALALDATVGTTNTEIGGLTETAPATDTASSGLNGRLQRIAQRITSLIALLPSALGATTKAASFSVALPTDQIRQPRWTDGTTITGIAVLTRGSVARATYAVTSKYGAYIYVYLARTGTTAITTLGLQVRIRRVVNGVTNLVPEAAFSADINAAVSAAMAGSGNNAAVTTVTLNASATFAAGTNGEIWAAILDSISAPTTVSEWVRMSKATDANNTSKLLDAPTTQGHNSTGHTMLDKANVFRAFVEGGCTYEIIVDYGAAGAGESYVYQILAQSLDSQGWA